MKARLFLLSSFFVLGITSYSVVAEDNQIGAKLATHDANVATGQVAVTVQSGRVFVAEVHARTDNDTLWLQYGTSNTTLLRPIRWQRVMQCERDGKLLDKTQTIRLASLPSGGRIAAEPSQVHNGNQTSRHRQGAMSDAERARRALGFDSP